MHKLPKPTGGEKYLKWHLTSFLVFFCSCTTPAPRGEASLSCWLTFFANKNTCVCMRVCMFVGAWEETTAGRGIAPSFIIYAGHYLSRVRIPCHTPNLEKKLSLLFSFGLTCRAKLGIEKREVAEAESRRVVEKWEAMLGQAELERQEQADDRKAVEKLEALLKARWWWGHVPKGRGESTGQSLKGKCKGRMTGDPRWERPRQSITAIICSHL